MRKLIIEEFIEKSNKTHGMKYDYSKVAYVNCRTNVCIICPEHGEFWQKADSHTRGIGCPYCGGTKKKTTKEFIQKANRIHGDKYNYSKVDYLDSKTKVIIICPEHGEFLQTPSIHLSKFGCPKCSNVYSYNANEFIEKANKVHGYKYDYSKTIYTNTRTKITIICNKHGEFLQRPNDHIKGIGCPFCNESKGEEKIREYLEDNNIEFNPQENFKNTNNPCKNPETNRFLMFDFYLPEHNLCIEYDGLQHFKEHSFGGNETKEKMNENFLKVKQNDNIKNKYCEENYIKLLRIPYWKQKNIKKILGEIL